MRARITLPDDLLLEAKNVAAERGTSLARLVEEGLRSYLAQLRAQAASETPLKTLPINRKARSVRGVDLTDTSALWDIE